MWRLIRKNFLMFLVLQILYFGLFFPLINQDRLFDENPLDLSFVVFLNSYMIWLVLGSVLGHEQQESKTNGYAFLNILPIRAHQIVASKYALAFLATACFVGVHLIWFMLSFDEPAFAAAARTSLINMAGLCLLLSGVYYLGFFRYGYRRFSKLALALWLLLIVVPLPTLILLKERFHIHTGDILLQLTRINPFITLAVCLPSFLGTLGLAVRFKKNRSLIE
jgi:hypothetical protein